MSQHVRADPPERLMCLADKCTHVVEMARVELGVAVSKSPLLILGVRAQSVIPDVVLSQTNVKIKGHILFCASQQSVDDGCSADQSRLVVRIG